MSPALKLLLLLSVTLLLSNCAQTAPPVPPSLELPKPVTDLKAVRKGDKVYLRWTVPAQTTDGESVTRLGTTQVCRVSDRAANRCDEAAGEVAPARPVQTSQKNVKPVAGTRPEANFIDTLPPEAQQDPARILSYSVSVRNESGRTAGISNRVQVSAAPTWPAPGDFKVEVTTDGVVLSWSAASPNPALHNFYRVYRRPEGAGSDTVAGEMPLDPAATQFVDHGFEWGKTYYYHATVVTEVSAGMHACGPEVHQPTDGIGFVDCATMYQVEGDDTPTVKVVANDIFPPSTPSGLQAVFSGPGQKPFIDLVWAPNMEGDLAGYNIYRREADGRASKLNSDLIKPPAFRDSDIQSGRQYLYSVTAVDARGNESGHSDEASEQVP